MSIPLPQEIKPIMPWLDRLEQMVGDAKPTEVEVHVSEVDEKKPEIHAVTTYQMSREEIESYLANKYGDKLSKPIDQKKPVGVTWRK
jgi:hypothetical protein